MESLRGILRQIRASRKNKPAGYLATLRAWEYPARRFWDESVALAFCMVISAGGVAFWATLSPFKPGIAIGILGTAAAVMSVRPEMKMPERVAWLVVLVLLASAEVRSIVISEHENSEKTQGIVDGINKEVDLGKQNLAISNTLLATVQTLSRQVSPSQDKQPLINAWGSVSQLKSKVVEGAISTPSNPPEIQRGRRSISAETLGLALKNQRTISAATIINDGTNEAGNFAKQLEIGLRMAGWQVGGDNIKMGDPKFFPDSLTLEVSSVPVSPDDHSIEEAKTLSEILKRQGIEVALRFTTLQFPPNFMRIKVSSQ